jgi:hypothetical protein
LVPIATAWTRYPITAGLGLDELFSLLDIVCQSVDEVSSQSYTFGSWTLDKRSSDRSGFPAMDQAKSVKEKAAVANEG